MLVVQSNLAITYKHIGRLEESVLMLRDVYCGHLKLEGEEHRETIREAVNYAASLGDLQRFGEIKVLLRKMMPVARRVLGESHDLMLRMRWIYGKALYKADAATLDELREAVTTLDEIARTAQRVLGGAHPDTAMIKKDLHRALAALGARYFYPRGAQVS